HHSSRRITHRAGDGAQSLLGQRKLRQAGETHYRDDNQHTEGKCRAKLRMTPVGHGATLQSTGGTAYSKIEWRPSRSTHEFSVNFPSGAPGPSALCSTILGLLYAAYAPDRTILSS